MAYNIKTTKIGKAPIDVTHCNSSPMKLTLNTNPLQYRSPMKTRPIATSAGDLAEGGGGTKDKTQSELLMDRQREKFKKQGDKLGKTMVDKGSW